MHLRSHPQLQVVEPPDLIYFRFVIIIISVVFLFFFKHMGYYCYQMKMNNGKKYKHIWIVKNAVMNVAVKNVTVIKCLTVITVELTVITVENSSYIK